VIDPVDPSTPHVVVRVLRGGSKLDDPDAFGEAVPSDYRTDNLGVRVVAVVEAKDPGGNTATSTEEQGSASPDQ